MDLNTITVADFKAQFFRDFPYLPTWDSDKIYNTGRIVYYAITELFYKCLENGVTELPTDSTKWVEVADDIYNYVLDDDISKSFLEAQVVFNQGLFGTEDQLTLGYLYLTAHYLVNDIQTSLQGLQSTAQFNVASRSAGSISESYSIPQRYIDDPNLSFYTKTGYGLKYLSFILPALVGNIHAVYGGTTP